MISAFNWMSIFIPSIIQSRIYIMERTRQRPEQSQSGSRTTTIENVQQDTVPPPQIAPPVGVLQLRGTGGNTRRVVWSEETVDNEGMGKKKSKICCIYHKPKAFDESSDESSGAGSDSDSDDDSDEDDKTSHSSSSLHDSESGIEDGVNASKGLRERKAGVHTGRKGKEKSTRELEEDCGKDSCKGHHNKKAKQKLNKKSKGSSTQTITITENTANQSSTKGKPNAYEKGVW